MWGIFDCQVVKTHQPGHVDNPVVHLPAFGTPRHGREQRVEQAFLVWRAVAKPAGPDFDKGAATELPPLVVLEQRALYPWYPGPHNPHKGPVYRTSVR